MSPDSELDGLLKREAETRELIRLIPPSVLGSRIRRARQRMGLSIRELAEAAHLSKTSVVRLEAGGTPQVSTLLRVCAALGIHVASIARPEGVEKEVVAIHRHENDEWFDLTDFGAGALAEPARRAELADVPLLILTSRLNSGRLLPTVLELYRESESRSHPGEEFVYVLSGRARITVGTKQFDLDEGESATFWSAEEHRYAPAGDMLPVRVLSVRIDDKPA